MKRILILTSRLPVPLTSGEKIRILNICRGLSREFELVLLSLCASKEELEDNSPELDIFTEVHKVYLPVATSLANTARALLSSEPLQVAYYRSDAFARKVDELLPGVDCVIAHLVRTSDYVRSATDVVKILEMTDAISLTYQRLIGQRLRKSIKSIIYQKEYRRLQRYERAVAEEFDMVSLISQVDKSYLAALGAPTDRIEIFTNGVTLEDLPYLGPGDGGDVVFIGNMRTLPNIDACRFMATEVLPLIHREEPSIRFKIIGSAPEAATREFSKYPGVQVVGRVAKIADAASGAFASVCPMRVGAGVQNKVLEYLALGLPCVTTSIGLEGIEAAPDQDLLISDRPADIAEAVLRLYRNREMGRALSTSGRHFVETEHTWAPIQDAYCRKVQGLLGK